MQAGGREFESLYLHSVRKRKLDCRSRTLKTAYTKHLKYVKRKIETKRGAVEIQRRNRNDKILNILIKTSEVIVINRVIITV